MATADLVEDVLGFWFPRWSTADRAAVAQQGEGWFRGVADAEVPAQFPALLESAVRGELAQWSSTPRSRLALILVLDQFSRTVYQGTPKAFTQDAKAPEG